MITLICRQINERHLFVFRTVFDHWLQIPWKAVLQSSTASTEEKYPIYYGTEAPDQGIFIPNCGLLEEEAIRSFVPETFISGEEFYLFPEKRPGALLPFDIFSAIFWLISRYEEYLPFHPDKHGRFEAEQSLLYQQGVHHIPVIDRWMKQLKEALLPYHPELKEETSSFKFIPTYDIDQIWSYRHKGFMRNFGGGARDFFQGKWGLVRERLQVLQGKKPDPFDSFDYILNLHQNSEKSVLFFIHPGTWGPYDKNADPRQPEASALIRLLESRHEVCIHPSYASAQNNKLLKEELALLSEIIGRPIQSCRQHFLRINLPETYRNYISCGITDDYSMGWAGDYGYRAGTGRSFPFFDLKKNTEMPLMIHPLVLMDGALHNYLKMPQEEAIKHIDLLLDESRKLNGQFISLWHNESLGNSTSWRDWQSVYEHLLEKASKEIKTQGK